MNYIITRAAISLRPKVKGEIDLHNSYALHHLPPMSILFPCVHVFPPCMTRGTKPGYKTSFPPSLPSHPSHFLYILQLFFPLPTQILLSLGASPNYRDAKGLTPVYHTAIMGDDTGACEALLRYRAELGIKDQGGWTELHQVGRITVTVPCIIIHQRLFHHIL